MTRVLVVCVDGQRLRAIVARLKADDMPALDVEAAGDYRAGWRRAVHLPSPKIVVVDARATWDGYSGIQFVRDVGLLLRDAVTIIASGVPASSWTTAPVLEAGADRAHFRPDDDALADEVRTASTK